MWLLAEPHPSSVIQDPPSRWERGGCCHGGLCAANSSRVKWEIFIPRVRERAGRQPGAGERDCPGAERPLLRCVGQVGLGVSFCLSQHFHLCPEAACFPHKGQWHLPATSWLSACVSSRPVQKVHRNPIHLPTITTP